MGLVESTEEIQQSLQTILNDIDRETAAAIVDAINADALPGDDRLLLINEALVSSPLLTRMLTEALNNDRFLEPCARLAAALRERLDNGAPCEFICKLVTICQNEFDSLLSSLEVDGLDELRKRRLVHLMAFIGHLFCHRAIRGNSIIQQLLNVLLGWDQERSRWRGQPQEYEINGACSLLSTVGTAYVSNTEGSRVYLTRLQNIETPRFRFETTRREIAELIRTWEQEW
eukprot:CAMPEP_0115207436 /NCGR_PEP_ID=MMETSP0270-20121206/20715_1 /TAXON_ID=71861 /ORGANISM="Scrippsiella trochoidea, Strain CCMP3099" /LENGTH=229 /DNA_ID=CAMNT_0002621029 /DNA_START=35 /DNA_END=721 /DNA_ORIENTATION=+